MKVDDSVRTTGDFRNYLVTYHPLCKTARGRKAISSHHLKPYIDGSCRREPDLESNYPSITALCRAGMFAPRLKAGDRVFYMSVKGRYEFESGRALVAALLVTYIAPTHARASIWYKTANQPLPSNCMVSGNQPMPLDKTSGLPRNTDKAWQKWGMPSLAKPSLYAWDEQYRRRAYAHPQFVITTPIRPLELVSPRIVSDSELQNALRLPRVPGTQRFKYLTDSQFDSLMQLARMTSAS